MEVGQVKVAEDKDFENLKFLVDNHTGWKLDYNKGNINVWTKNVSNTNFKMVKVKAEFTNISSEQLYDVLHDPEYRKVWDQHMIEAKDIGCLNPNNDVGYYSMSCPTPLGNRDFVLQRSWLDLGNEKYILNHSVYHCQHPPRQGFIRATSYLTGYLVRSYPNTAGCELGYISQTDPQGTLPPWLVNRVTQIFGPKLIKDLQKASLGYAIWKANHNPNWKPWHFPEQIISPRIKLQEILLDLKEEDAVEIDSKNYTTTKDKERKVSYSEKKQFLSNRCIISQLFIFMSLGLEISTVSLAFLFYNLASNPEVQQKVRQEVDEAVKKFGHVNYEVLTQLHYLDCVIQESLRLCASTSCITRVCQSSYRLPGSDLVLEKGTTVMIPTCAVHLDPLNYPGPGVFDPERFRGNHFKPSPTYLPLGAGPRMCIAFNLVILQLKVAVAKVMQHFEMSLNTDTQLPVRYAPQFMPKLVLNSIKVDIRSRT